jgi:uncharacterized protein (DUF1800 family)
MTAGDPESLDLRGGVFGVGWKRAAGCYARELMQLFTTGLVLLNPDGTPQLDASGNQQLVYTEAQVQAFARAYTGWTFATATGGVPTKFPNGTANYNSPMIAVESAHMTAKVLLLGTTLPGWAERGAGFDRCIG